MGQRPVTVSATHVAPTRPLRSLFTFSARLALRGGSTCDPQRSNVVRGSLRYVRDEKEIAQIYEMYNRGQRESMRAIHEDGQKRGCKTADGKPWTLGRFCWTAYFGIRCV